MTQEAIDYNIQRLMFFLGHEGEIPYFHYEISDNTLIFLHNYARLMDYYGAGREQYSLILLSLEDYEKTNEYLTTFKGYRYTEDFKSENLPHGPAVSMLGQITFECDGFTWYIRKIKSYPEIKK